MSIYGNYMNEDKVYELQEQAILQEMMFSKDDLQNPETLDKILKKQETYKKVSNVGEKIIIVSALIEAVAALVASVSLGGGVIIGSIASILTIAGNVKLYIFVDNLPRWKYKKNMEKFKKNCIKLKETCEKKLEKDPKNADKYKAIIENCNKTLKAIEEKEKAEKDTEFKKKVDKAVKEYEHVINSLFNFYIDLIDDNVQYILYKLKITPQKLGKYIAQNNTKSKDNLETILEYIWGTSNEKEILNADGGNKKYYEEIKNIFKDGGYDLGRIDDTAYLLNTKGIIYITDYVSINVYDKFDSEPYILDDKALIEADKQLGYYRLSECPKGVTPKKFPNI